MTYVINNTCTNTIHNSERAVIGNGVLTGVISNSVILRGRRINDFMTVQVKSDSLVGRDGDSFYGVFQQGNGAGFFDRIDGGGDACVRSIANFGNCREVLNGGLFRGSIYPAIGKFEGEPRRTITCISYIVRARVYSNYTFQSGAFC